MAKQTDGFIKNLLPTGSLAEKNLVQTAALHFRAKWNVPFNEPNASSILPFYLPSGEVKNVAMLEGEIPVQYSKGDNTTVLDIPYDYDTLRMLVIMPNRSLTDYLSALDANGLTSLQESLESKMVQLAMPPFSIHQAPELTNVLRAMGMNVALSHDAQFSIYDGTQEQISAIYTQTDIDVNARGTEAATASAAVAKGATAVLSTPATIDHPFLYFIHEKTTGTILFAGQVQDPTLGDSRKE